MKFLVLILMLFVELRKGETIGEWDGCDISPHDARSHPWLATLQIVEESKPVSVGEKMNETLNVYDWWPVVIIEDRLLLTSGRTFRSPHSDQRMRIRKNDEYRLNVPNELWSPKALESEELQELTISYIKPYPKIGERSEYWMKTENDIVLIHLIEPIKFTRRVRRLCLPPFEEEIRAGVDTMLSGWQCEYHYAVKGLESAIYLETQDFDKCNETWHRQAAFSLDNIPPYKCRTCGVPILTEAGIDSVNLSVSDPGFCTVKSYFNILTRNNNERILVGLFNGVAHEYMSGPTVYVSKLVNNTLEWIRNSTKCGPLNYTCNNGDCVDLSLDLVCNGKKEEVACKDGSDEGPCFCRAKNYCAWDQFECGYMGECIPKGGKNPPAECNGRQDCLNGEDENAPLYHETCEPRDNDFGTWLSDNWTYVIFSGIGTFFFVLAVGGTIVRKLTWKNADLHFTEEEVTEFFQGSRWDESVIEAAESHQIASDGEDVHLRAMRMPYIYDLDKDKIAFGLKRTEGSTAEVFGGKYDGTTVIIKTISPKVRANRKKVKQIFKLFLAELKTMAYVNFIKGGHQNIIQLVGAYTGNIRNLDIITVTEYCHWGSISEYLKDHQGLFQNSSAQLPRPPLPINREYISRKIMTQAPAATYISAAVLETTYAVGHVAFLYKWAQEIIEGMCFLMSHKIIHGDLAARNIMLDHNLIAKIGDFGLSRQIYYYNMSSTEVDRSAYIPWGWMAPEVIGNVNMSIKSDVWSFGVTMWELFTLGRLPYGGLEWTPNFIDQLRFGLRLTKPQYAHPDMFDIVKRCWQFFPHDRPDFDMLRTELHDLLNKEDQDPESYYSD